jgi:hypothetical protein
MAAMKATKPTLALSSRLERYLKLESIMIDLEENNAVRTDRVLDLMDRLWYGLSDEERKFLDSRGEIQPPTHPPRKK